MSNEKNLGWLFDIGDEILPSNMGIIINHEIRIPFLNKQDSMESKNGFFRGSSVFALVMFRNGPSQGFYEDVVAAFPELRLYSVVRVSEVRIFANLVDFAIVLS